MKISFRDGGEKPGLSDSLQDRPSNVCYGGDVLCRFAALKDGRSRHGHVFDVLFDTDGSDAVQPLAVTALIGEPDDDGQRGLLCDARLVRKYVDSVFGFETGLKCSRGRFA